MRIDENTLRQILQAYGPKGKAAPTSIGSGATAGASSRDDEITISSEGKELQRMIRAARQADDIRADRVAELRTKLRTGAYKLDPQLIAQRMLDLSGNHGS